MIIDAREVPMHQRLSYENTAVWLIETRRAGPKFFHSDGTPEMQQQARLLATNDFEVLRDILTHILLAQSYFVSNEMTVVMKAASQSLPRQELLKTDLPSPLGYILYADPIYNTHEDVGIQAVMWRTSDDAAGVLVTQFAYVRSSWSFAGTFSWKFGQEPFNMSPNRHMASDVGQLLLTTWSLMQQKLPVVDVVDAHRAERRRWGRHNVPAPRINVVQLRKNEAHSSPGAEQPVEWSHRWMVDGHWRNQWFPSIKTNRYIWIAPYVKGPADMPLVVHETVQAWVR